MFRYLLGNTPTAPDFHLWEMLDQHEILARGTQEAKQGTPSSFLGDYSRLSKFYKAFRGLKELEGYFASDAYKLPLNNKMANFGAKYIP
jgi:hypothetical protein